MSKRRWCWLIKLEFKTEKKRLCFWRIKTQKLTTFNSWAGRNLSTHQSVIIASTKHFSAGRTEWKSVIRYDNNILNNFNEITKNMTAKMRCLMIDHSDFIITIILFRNFILLSELNGKTRISSDSRPGYLQRKMFLTHSTQGCRLFTILESGWLQLETINFKRPSIDFQLSATNLCDGRKYHCHNGWYCNVCLTTEQPSLTYVGKLVAIKLWIDDALDKQDVNKAFTKELKKTILSFARALYVNKSRAKLIICTTWNFIQCRS